MNDWAVAGFVSRVAERVTTVGEGLAAQLADRYSLDSEDYTFWALRLPRVEPSLEFVDELGRRLMAAPVVLEPDAPTIDSSRRLVYGVAAVGSLASAAVLVAIILRNRSFNRAAA